MIATEIRAACAAALVDLDGYQVWKVTVSERGVPATREPLRSVTYAIGPDADAVTAAYWMLYAGDWLVSVEEVIDHPRVDGRRTAEVNPCAWCAKCQRYAH